MPYINIIKPLAYEEKVLINAVPSDTLLDVDRKQSAR